MNRRIFRNSLCMAILALFALVATPALHAASACPTPLSLTNPALDGTAGGEELATGYLSIINANQSTANITCNVLITFNSNGSITTTNPNGNGFYDAGGEDNVVGVVNNTSSAITSINLSGSIDIFGFDGDGICGYNFSATSVSCGTATGYLPQGVTDSNVNGTFTSGTINFGNGGIAPGGTGFFSLEGPVDINLRVNPTPEPGTLILFGTGIAGLAGAVRRRFMR